MKSAGQNIKLRYAIMLIPIALLIKNALCNLEYPITIGGFTADTILEGFIIDSSGNLFVEVLDRDENIVPVNVALYFPVSSITWYWALQITTQDTLMDMQIRASDNFSLFLLYQSLLVVVMDVSTGIIVNSFTLGTQQCPNYDCTAVYLTSNLNIICSFYGCTTCSNFLQFTSITDTTRPTSADTLSYSSATYDLFYPVSAATDDGRILLGVKSVTPDISILMGIPISFTQIDFLATFHASAKIMGVSYISSGTSMIGFLYSLDESLNNVFYLSSFDISSTTPGINMYCGHQATLATNVQFIDMQPISINSVYILTYFGGTNQIVLFNAFLSINPNTYSFTATQIGIATSPLTIPNGQIDATNGYFYVGGNDAQYLFTKPSVSGGVLHSTAFVYSFQTADSIISPPAQITSTAPMTAGIAGILSTVASSIPFLPGAGAYSSLSISSSPISTPTIPTTTMPNCLIQYYPTGYPYVFNYYIGDTLSGADPPALIPSGTSCTYLNALEIANSAITLTYNQITQIGSFYTNSVALDGTSVNLIMIAIFPGTQVSSCHFYYKSATVSIIYPQIVTTTVNPMVYNIGSSFIIQMITPFTNNKGILDAKLVIQYFLTYANGNPYSPGVVSSFDSTNLIITVQTSDDTLPRVNSMVLYAYFIYNPAYLIQVPFTITLEKCFQTVIYTTPISTIFYQLGIPAVVTNIAAWTDKYQSDCGAFTYTLIGATSYITLTASPLQVSVVGNAPLSAGVHPMILGGTLNQPVTNTIYQSASLIFNVVIIDPSVSIITPSATSSQTYVLMDSALNFAINAFSTNNAQLQIYYEVMNSDGTPFDIFLFSFDSSILQMTIHSNDPSLVGSYQLMIKAFFSPTLPYYVTSSFTVIVLHWCSRNIITAPIITPDQYILTSQMIERTIEPWTLSMYQLCQPVTYLAKLDNGQVLPNLVKFNSTSLVFKIFSPLPEDVGFYQIVITGTTAFYDVVSRIHSSFNLTVICESLNIAPQDKSLIFNYLVGSPVPLKITYKPFVVQPQCLGPPPNITYSATLVQNRPLPNFIEFYSNSNTLTVKSDETAHQGMYQVLVLGEVNPSVGAVLAVNINVIKGNLGINLILQSQGLQLPPVSIEIFTNQTKPTVFQSIDFIKLTDVPYQMIIVDPTLTFVTFNSQTLSFTPTVNDQGTHQMYLMSETDYTGANATESPKMIYQILIIDVILSPDQQGFEEVKAIISSISRTGQVYIDFNQVLVNIQNASIIVNSTALQLTMADADSSPQSINYTWSTLNFYQSQPQGSIITQRGFGGSRLILQLQFSDPLLVSFNKYDYLNVIVLNRTLFQSELTGLQISYRYSLFKRIPQQLDYSAASLYLDKFTTMVQSAINYLNQSSTFLQFFLALFLNQLWGMIKTIQIILIFPLTLVMMPANVQLLYYFMTYNFNMQLIPSNSIGFSFLNYGDDQQPLNNEFDNQDIF